jgi:branched-chain amino acid transport system substrate-binding protein
MTRHSFWIIFSLFFSICSSSVSTTQAEVVVAVMGAMSGDWKEVGNQFKLGVRQAVEDLTLSSGLLGESIKIIVRDDDCKPDKAREIAQELASLNVSLVVGGTCSGASVAASEIFAKHGILQISPSSTAPSYTERGFKNVFRTCGRDDIQGFVVAEHMVRRHGSKKIGILYDASVYSTELAQYAKDALNKAGKQEVFFVGVPRDAVNFSKVLSEIQLQSVEVVFFPSYTLPVINFLKQAKKLEVTFKLVGGDTYLWDGFSEQGGDLIEGVEFSFSPNPAHDRRNRKLTRRLKKGGYNPETLTFYNYAVVQVWVEAVKKAQTFNGIKVAEALRSGTFETVLGKITFDGKGDISEPGFVMYSYVEGEADYLQ